VNGVPTPTSLLIRILKEHTMSHSEGRVPDATAAGIMLIFDSKTMWPLVTLRGVLAILFGIAALIGRASLSLRWRCCSPRGRYWMASSC
jgi:hypothetical protein